MYRQLAYFALCSLIIRFKANTGNVDFSDEKKKIKRKRNKVYNKCMNNTLK